MGNTNNSDKPIAANSVAQQTPAKARKPPKRFDPDPNYLRPSDDPNHWNNSSSLLAILPPEIIVEIFSLLEAKELALLSQSCKKSREIAYDYDRFWEAYMDMGLKRFKVTDDLAIEVISKFGPVKTNWNFAICEQIHNQTLEHMNKYCSTIALLNLASCRNITDQGIMQFTDKFASLTELNLSHTDITDAGLKHIVTCAPRLNKLTLRATRLSDLTMLESLHNLTELDLSAPRLMGSEIKFPVIPSLKTLNIAKFQFPYASQGPNCGSGELVKALQMIPNLTALDVSCTSVEIINAIGSMKHLRRLGARAEGYWGEVDIKKTLLSICPSLTYLDMSGGQESIQWHQMIVVAVENSPNLKTLVINNNFRLSTRLPKLFELIYEHMNLTYLEGYGYVFDGDHDKELVRRLRTKPGLKVVTDGI